MVSLANVVSTQTSELEFSLTSVTKVSTPWKSTILIKYSDGFGYMKTQNPEKKPEPITKQVVD